MIRAFTVGKSKWYGIIVGRDASIITEKDCCHEIVSNKGFVTLLDVHTSRQHTLSVKDLIATAAPVTAETWVHYFGIKPRIERNYKYLLCSMREIGLDASAMPKWDKTLRFQARERLQQQQGAGT